MSPPEVPQAAAPWRVVLATTLAYAFAGAVSLVLAGPPGYAAPLWPAAGIGLAAVLCCGRVALWGVVALLVRRGHGRCCSFCRAEIHTRSPRSNNGAARPRL